MSRAIGFLVTGLSGAERERHEAEIHREARVLGHVLTMIGYAEEMSEAGLVRLLNLVDRERAVVAIVPSREHFGELDLVALLDRADVRCLDEGRRAVVRRV
ncbi:hypothetical protein [Nocardia sp. IFM 10818]